MAFLRRVIAGVLSALLVSVTGTASARQWTDAAIASAAAHIESLDVERVRELRPGVQLNFSLYGTPGGIAVLHIEGVGRDVELRELQPGVYEGIYVVNAQDRITADSEVVATLRLGTERVSETLDEPLLLGSEALARASRPEPERREDYAKGPPVYDHAPRPGTMHSIEPAGEDRPLPARNDAACDCAMVESIRAVESAPAPGFAGMVAGGVLGAIVAESMAGRDDRQIARIVGALGGAVAGHAIEWHTRAPAQYEVVLRRPRGAGLIRIYDSPPPFRVGDVVPLGPDLGGARAERSADTDPRRPLIPIGNAGPVRLVH
jgi:outer membrane lipoprotein SlyB